MKIRFLAGKTPFIIFDATEADRIVDAAREGCIREVILDDPSYTREAAAALYRQATREALAGGF